MAADKNPRYYLPRGALQALGLLAGPQTYAVEDERGAYVVVGRPRGVSVRIGAMPASVVPVLLAADLAIWEDAPGAGRRRLVATAAGRARAAREATPADIDPWLAQNRPLRRGSKTQGDAASLIDDGESPLAWLARRRGRDGRPLVDAACLQAGERLRRDLTLGALLPKVTAGWGTVGGSGARSAGPAAFSDTVIAARQRARKALSAVGPDFAGLLLDVCGFLKGLEVVEREHGWPVRSGKLVLDLALRQLCRHYGIAALARGGPARGTRHWGAADFRPLLPETLAQD